MPLPQQLALALPLWLLTAFIAHTADRRLPPTAAASSNSTVAPLPQPLSELLASFLAAAVLPCVVAYLRDTYLVRPRYTAYLQRQGHQQQQRQEQEQRRGQQQERRQGQQQQAASRSPRPGVKAQGATSPVNGSHTASSPRLCTALSPNSSVASPAGIGGRGAVVGSEAGEAAAAGPQAGGGVVPDQQASTATEPAAHTPVQPTAGTSAASPHPQFAKARWDDCSCGAAATALAPGRSGHTRAPMHRRPTLDITLSEPHAASSSPHGPLLLPSRRALSLSSTHNQTQPPSATAGSAAIASSAAVPSAHLGAVATGYTSAAASTRSSSSLYRLACPLGQVHTLSVKVPLRHHAGAGACRVPVFGQYPHTGCCLLPSQLGVSKFGGLKTASLC